MAIGFEKKGSATRRVRFTSDLSHNGIDYGPQYDNEVAELDARDAANYVRSGRARYEGDGVMPEKEAADASAPQPGGRRR